MTAPRAAGWLVGVGAVLGFVGVAAGAFAAHGLKARLEPEMLAVFETGVRYQMYHALALVAAGALARVAPSRAAAWAGGLWVAGVVIFSGTLYALALTGLRWFGAITPVGGVLLLAGWLALAVAARSMASALAARD